MAGPRRFRWRAALGVAALAVAAVGVARWERIRDWVRPPVAGLPGAGEIVELRAQVWASGSRGHYETDVPEFVVPPAMAPRIWRRFDGAEHVPDPPVSRDEPLGELVATTRTGEVVRVTFFEAGPEKLVFTRDGRTFFQTEPRNDEGFPLGGGIALGGTLRHAWMVAQKRE